MKTKYFLPILALVMPGFSVAQDETQNTGETNFSDHHRGIPTLAVNVIYTEIGGDPSATVPGLSGADFIQFDRIYGHPNGQWVISALTNLPSAINEVVIANDQLVVQEGTQVPWNSDPENFGNFDQRLDINGDGQVVFTTNTNGTPTQDEYIVLFDGANFQVIAQEGQSVAALPAANYGSILESAVIADTGAVGFVADQITNTAANQDEILVLGDTLLAQVGVTAPSGQLDMEFWENFDVADFAVTANNQTWMIQGDLTGDGSTDDVLVINGEVVIQQGVALSGTGMADVSNGIFTPFLLDNGDHLVRGTYTVSNQDWVYGQEQLITTLGMPIITGSTEVWSDAEFEFCYFLQVGNGYGDFVIGGVSNGDTAANGLLVKNNALVVAREGDPVDLDGNGLFDDDLFFNTFGNDDAVLFDDGGFIFVATLRNGAGTEVGEGLFRVETDTDLIFRSNLDY